MAFDKCAESNDRLHRRLSWGRRTDKNRIGHEGSERRWLRGIALFALNIGTEIKARWLGSERGAHAERGAGTSTRATEDR
jgi:hypothetical protein